MTGAERATPARRENGTGEAAVPDLNRARTIRASRRVRETPAASTLSVTRKKALDYAPLSDQPLAFQIVVGLLVVHVPVRVLVLLVHLLVPAPGALALEGLVQRQRFGDGRDLRVRENSSVSEARSGELWPFRDRAPFRNAPAASLLGPAKICTRVGQVTGFLGPRACASSSNVRAQCVCPSCPTREFEKPTREKTTRRVGVFVVSSEKNAKRTSANAFVLGIFRHRMPC